MATEPVIGLRSWPKGRDMIRKALDAALNDAFERIGGDASSDASELNGLRYRAKAFEQLQTEKERLEAENLELTGRLNDKRRELSVHSEVEGEPTYWEKKASQYERENRDLKDQLDNALEKLRNTDTSNNKAETSITRPTSKPIGERLPTLSPTRENGETQTVGRAIYQHLVLKFNNLHQNHQELMQARTLLEGRLRRAKDLRIGWEHFSNGQKLYIRKLLSQLRENRLTPFPYPDDLRRPGATLRSSTDVEPGTSSSHGQKTGPLAGDTDRISISLLPSSDNIGPEDDDEQLVEPLLPTLPANVAEGSLTKSDDLVFSSTQGDVDSDPLVEVQDEVTIKIESPESPVIVSCRSVKRNRNNQQSQKDEVKPKVEDFSSPIGLGGLYGQNESIDLDDVGQHIPTPKKKRQQMLDDLLNASNQPIMKPVSFDSSGNTQTSIAEESSSTYGRRGASAPAIDTTPVPPRRNTALQTLSTNKKVLSRTSDARAPKRRREEDRMAGAHLFSEDGENVEGVARSNFESKISTPKPTKRSKLDQSTRLTGLLENPSPRQNVLIPGVSPRTPRVKSPTKGKSDMNLPSPTIAQRLHVSAGREPVDEARSKPRHTLDLANDSAGPSKPSARKSARISGEHVGGLVDDPDNEPYRARPLSKLSLEHFKVNPSYNQGYEYAFTDVVRKRDERMCLPGCTDPTCCGDKFRKLAEAMIDNRKGTKAEEEEEKRVLKDYLGSDYSRFQHMSKDEKHETLLEAMARELANKHGKHRHAYERRKSPPGFWRADFPTTQEEEEDREAASKVVREKVKERYMAAMRPNGPWLFRDE